eukprot:TRINITY_DN18682_c0_g1_i2.p1 TRINITY_DN18682_c0_g1~~TRINITY_DN18682_c0_g1_i2.p1  ORF type:complete len:571 (+),score=186.66 TRINITY_DN18682_c0_g1_i2:51-1763(+)
MAEGAPPRGRAAQKAAEAALAAAVASREAAAVAGHLAAGGAAAAALAVEKYLCAAAGRGDAETVEFLVAACNVPCSLARRADRRTALHIAAAQDHEAVALWLVTRVAEEGGDVNAEDANGATPLSIAAAQGSEALCRALLVAGADVNAGRLPPLTRAARSGSAALCRLLLAHGADVNRPAQNGHRTALCLAAAQGHGEVVAVLLAAPGIDAAARNSNGETAWDVAVARGWKDVAAALPQAAAVPSEAPAPRRPLRFTLFTAYSDDYSIGRLCSAVNQRYCARHGYGWVEDVLPYAAMLDAIAPRRHCTWYKVVMLRRLMAADASAEHHHYFVWVDADAVVANQDVPLEALVEEAAGAERFAECAGGLPHLVVGEDLHAGGNLFNAGVFLTHPCPWSDELWRRVWESERYFACTFYEQSALMRAVRSLGDVAAAGWQRDTTQDGLFTHRDTKAPWFSYAQPAARADVAACVAADLPRPPHDVKRLPHVAVFPRDRLNSNMVADWETSRRRSGLFIFHPAGDADKLNTLVRAVTTVPPDAPAPAAPLLTREECVACVAVDGDEDSFVFKLRR